MNDTVETTAEQAAAPVQSGKEYTFFFKKSPVRDAEGKKIGEGRKHPDVKAVLPVPLTMEDVIAAIGAQPKVADLVLEALQGVVYDAARAQINGWREDAGEDADFTADKFDLDKLRLEYLATLERASRAGYAPSDEEMKAFCEDYADVMLNIVAYDAKKVSNHCELFKKGLTKLRTNKKALGMLRDVMALYASKTSSMEDHAQVFGWLDGRADRWIKAEEKDYTDAI